MGDQKTSTGEGSIILGALTELVDATRSRVTKLNNLTETSVLGIGRSLGEIVDSAKGYAKQARATLEHIGASEGGAGVAGAIGKQNNILSNYVAQVRKQVDKQNSVAEQAVQASSRIAQMGNEISSVASQTRLLSLNASIEAERIGNAGKAFGVIAAEMTNLSRQVESTSRSVNEVVSTLSQSLPDVAHTAREIRSSSDRFITEISASIAHVDEQARGIQESARKTVRNGDECIATILRLSQGALSCLQFQDPVAQGMQAIVNDLSSAVSQCEALLAARDGNGEWSSATLTAALDNDLEIKKVSVVAPYEEAADPGELVLF